MIDLLHRFSAINALPPTTGNGAQSGDYVAMKDAHAIWCIMQFDRPTAGACAITHEVAQNFAGTGSTAVSTGVQHWATTDAAAKEFLTPKTSLAYAYTLPSSTGKAMVISRFDPSCVPTNSGTSNTHYAVKLGTLGSANDAFSAVYLIENRYSGLRKVLATTSST